MSVSLKTDSSQKALAPQHVKPHISPITRMPTEILDVILTQAANGRASEVSREFREINTKIISANLEETLAAVNKDPIIAAYLDLAPPRLSPQQKLKFAYQNMSKDLLISRKNNRFIPDCIFNAFPRLFIKNPSIQTEDLIFKPELFSNLANETRNQALKEAWPYIRVSLLGGLLDQERLIAMLQNLPERNASVEEIRAWLTAEENQAAIRAVEHLDIVESRLTCLPEEIKRFTGIARLAVVETQMRVLPAGILNNFPRLNHVMLQGNLLRKIPSTLLRNNPFANHIDFSYNLLSSIPADLVSHLPHGVTVIERDYPISTYINDFFIEGRLNDARLLPMLVSGAFLEARERFAPFYLKYAY